MQPPALPLEVKIAALAAASVIIFDSVELLGIDRSLGQREHGIAGRMLTDDGTSRGAGMAEREFFHLGGRTWLVRVRSTVRRDETDTHVTLELIADHETRVVSCRRDE